MVGSLEDKGNNMVPTSEEGNFFELNVSKLLLPIILLKIYSTAKIGFQRHVHSIFIDINSFITLWATCLVYVGWFGFPQSTRQY